MSVQKSEFLLINATVMTLGQGHRKVIQYISLDLYIVVFFFQICKVLAQMVLTWEAKVFAAADVETNWKYKVAPDQCDLIISTYKFLLWLYVIIHPCHNIS